MVPENGFLSEWRRLSDQYIEHRQIGKMEVTKFLTMESSSCYSFRAQSILLVVAFLERLDPCHSKFMDDV
jgi:hypothetical protein